MLRVLTTINDVICKILKYVTIMLLAAMSIIIFAQVLFRYVLQRPLSWSEECSIYLFTWCAFTGAAMIMRKDLHIRITAFINLVKSKQAQKVIVLISDVLILAFFILICSQSVNLVSRMIIIDQRSPSMVWLNIGYVFACVPISMFFMGLFRIEKIIRSFVKQDQAEMGGEIA